jgi:hypothetical protein
VAATRGKISWTAAQDSEHISDQYCMRTDRAESEQNCSLQSASPNRERKLLCDPSGGGRTQGWPSWRPAWRRKDTYGDEISFRQTSLIPLLLRVEHHTRGVACLTEDREAHLAFFNFPAMPGSTGLMDGGGSE